MLIRIKPYTASPHVQLLALALSDAGTQAASGAESQGHELHAQQGSVSVSGSASDQGDSDDDGDNILADDPDAVNASTQRLLRGERQAVTLVQHRSSTLVLPRPL